MSASGTADPLAQRFVDLALRNEVNSALLQRLALIGLPDCWVVAGCLFQPVWNAAIGRPVGAGIKDYDIFYFDAADVSWEAEDQHIARVRAAVADLGIAFDLKNQARVHLWYKQRFGHDYPQLTSASDGIRRFLVAGTCLAISVSAGATAQVYAPYGLTDCFDGVLRPNPIIADPLAAFHAKAESYRARWPHLWVTTEMPTSAWQTARGVHPVLLSRP